MILNDERNVWVRVDCLADCLFFIFFAFRPNKEKSISIIERSILVCESIFTLHFGFKTVDDHIQRVW